MPYRIKAGKSVLVFDRRENKVVQHTVSQEQVFEDEALLVDGTGNCMPNFMGKSLVAAGYTLFKTDSDRWPSMAIPSCELEVV